MDNVLKKIFLTEISSRIFFRYYPVWILIGLAIGAIAFNPLGAGGAIFVAVLLWVIIVIWTFFCIIPIIIFKPERSLTRRLAMILTAVVIVYNNFLAFDFFNEHNPFINTVSFSLLEVKTVSCLNYLSIGLTICWMFYIEEKQYIAEMKTIEERNKRILNEKKLTEIHLRLLQAQIEPHFLFNTLTSILGLGKKDPQKAKMMQKNFMQYLKTTLDKTRESITTIGQEIELINAYLDIFKVRMGKRLSYTIKFDDEIKPIPFPSMLIQPIIENAVKHGLEPKVGGGEINIIVKTIESNRIQWDIEDTGLGMSDKADKGTGLSNVMERLKSLYGDEGHLTIMDNKPSGVKVTLEVPCD